MTKAAANPKRGNPRAPAPASAVAAPTPTPTPTPAEIRAERREFAAAPERVERRQAESQVLKAVHLCRPGTQRGPASPLWRSRREGGIGMGGVYEAAQLYLIDHLSADQVRQKLGLPATKSRALDRLLYLIQEEHTQLLLADVEARASAEATAPIEGDVVALGLHFASQVIRQTSTEVGRMKWGELDQAERNTTLRLCEWVSDIVRSASTAQHKEAQTERIERMLRREVEEASAKGQTQVPVDRLRALVAAEMGLGEGGGA
ncbi:MAG: hypothetical protein VKL39_24885 [Leptolyngbyaceae bacterium]|nr:hypothetical protein [Leptolyngbyaceae bacterium]